MKLKPQKIGKAGQLAMLMSMPALDGNIVLLVLGGLFSLQNVMLIGLTVMSGPGAFIQSATLDATTKERILVSVVNSLTAVSLSVFLAVIVAEKLAFLLIWDPSAIPVTVIVDGLAS